MTTKFTEQTTQHEGRSEGPPPLMSKEGEELAKKTAPRSALTLESNKGFERSSSADMLLDPIFRR